MDQSQPHALSPQQIRGDYEIYFNVLELLILREERTESLGVAIGSEKPCFLKIARYGHKIGLGLHRRLKSIIL